MDLVNRVYSSISPPVDPWTIKDDIKVMIIMGLIVTKIILLSCYRRRIKRLMGQLRLSQKSGGKQWIYHE